MTVGAIRKGSSGSFFDPPGGGVLRVPASGGAPEEVRGEANGQTLVWNASSGLWVPGDVGIGSIQYFQALPSTVGLWNFDRTLADALGLGNDFVRVAGAYGFSPVVPGVFGLRYAVGSRFQVPSFVPDLLLTGAMTAEMIVARDTTPQSGTSTIWFAYGASGTDSDPANNTVYEFSVPAGTDPPVPMTTFWEEGGGVNVGNSSSTANGADSLGNIHGIEYLAFTRTDSGVVQFYLDGRPFGAPSAPLPMPTGGGNGRLNLAAADGGVSTTRNTIMGLRLSDEAFTEEEIADAYNLTLGPAYGTV